MDSSQEHPPLRRQAISVVAWRIVGILATLGANILAARLLGPAEFGIYLLVTTLMALGGLIGMTGLNEAGLRFVSESLALDRHGLARAYLRRVLATVAIASLLAAVVMATGMILFQAKTGRFHDPLLLILLTSFGIVALAWQQISAESLRSYGDLRRASFFSGGQTGGPVSNLLLLAGLVVAGLTIDKLNVSWAVALTVISIGLTCPLALLSVWRTSQASHSHSNDGSPVLSNEQRRELLAVGSVLLVNQILAFGSQQLDIWLGGALLDPESLGLYGAAKRSLLLAAMPVQMAMMTVLATIPRLHAQKRTRDLERVLRSAATYAAIPAGIALVLLGLFPDTILRLVFGGSYTGAASTVMVLVVGHLVLVLSGNPSHVLTMTGRHRTVLVVNLATAILLVVVGVIGAKLFGAPGLAVGSAASLAFQNGLLWWLARRHLGLWTHVGLPLRSIGARSISPSPVTLESGRVSAVLTEA